MDSSWSRNLRIKEDGVSPELTCETSNDPIWHTQVLSLAWGRFLTGVAPPSMSQLGSSNLLHRLHVLLTWGLHSEHWVLWGEIRGIRRQYHTNAGIILQVTASSFGEKSSKPPLYTSPYILRMHDRLPNPCSILGLMLVEVLKVYLFTCEKSQELPIYCSASMWYPYSSLLTSSAWYCCSIPSLIGPATDRISIIQWMQVFS